MDWLKTYPCTDGKDWITRLSIAEKRVMMEPNHRRLRVRRQCDLRGLTRFSYYREPKFEKEEDLELKSLIDKE
ncbi:MAG: hypothetical protein JRI72_03035 [Deltaproteobacteria bacterium]|nr:hypothetical protein [Deltaproteobacteria bacterium]